MINALRHDFHTDMALTIANEIQYKRSNYYYFLGKIEPWANDTDTASIVQTDSDYENNLIRSNMIFMRKIGPNDVSVTTNRYDWTANTVYHNYDHTKNLKELNFYCVTDENIVYKCLDNAGGSTSTVKPIGNSFYPFRTNDGYLWKYMFTIPTFKRSRFMSVDKMPVQRALTDSFYNKGSVDAVYISNPGSGYADVLLTTISVVGTTSGTGAAATIVVGDIGNIVSVNITNQGSGYTNGVNISINSVSGAGAILTPTIVGGQITNLTISNGGIGYVNGNSINFTVGGAIIIPSVSRLTGSIESVTILNSGAGYTTAPVLTVSSATGGTGIYGNSTALLSCVIFQGKIVNVLILDPGINYPSDNNTTITVQGDGIGASFSPIISDGELIDIVIENSGTGYTSMTLTVSGTGTGALLTPIISASDFLSDQSIVEQTTVIGGIYSIAVENGGTNYSSSAVVSITGDGTGCTATPVIVDGVIKNIIVNSFGSGYTYANFTVTDTLRGAYTNFIDASGYIILTPSGGHGKDAVTELYGDTLAINSSLRQDINLNKLLQDYRQFGLIKNPKNILTGKLSKDESILVVYETIFNTTSGLVLDEILTQNNIKFRVVYFTGTTVYLQQLGINSTNIIGGIVAETNSARTYTINSVVKYPTANKYSGGLLYVSNENPFTFSQEQGIVIKTFLKF